MQSEYRSELGAELAKFLFLAQELGGPLEMFSEVVDAEWHRLIQHGKYPAFCQQYSLPEFGHSEHHNSAEPKKISWVSSYEERFGELPTIWFQKKNGEIDADAYTNYRQTRVVYASWDCGPIIPENVRVNLPGTDDLRPRVRVPSDPNTTPHPGEDDGPAPGKEPPPSDSDKN